MDAEHKAPPGSAPGWSEDVASVLEAHLQRLQKSQQPTVEDAATRQQAIARLQALLADIFPPPSSITLVPYGSFLTGCYSHSSDLDLALTGFVEEEQLYWTVPEYDPAYKGDVLSLEQVVARGSAPLLLEKLAADLEKRGAVKGRVDRGGLPARVPVIRLVEATTGVACDVCVCTRGCELKGEAMRLLQGLQPALASLTRLVKAWARHHDINCALRGTLNSWSLELLAVFSLQTHPGGPLLPPMWRLFGDTPPPAHGIGARPLQGSAEPPAEALARAVERCSGSARAELRPADPAPPLSELFLWFLASTARIMEDWRVAAGPFVWDSSSTRVSTWLGRLHDRAYDKKPYGTLPYVALIEEPFDASDNTARSLGTKSRNEDTLPYIAWVFGHSHHTLSAAASVADACRALLWLFGPAALPCLTTTTSPAALIRHLSNGNAEHVSTAVTEALQQLCTDGPGAAEGVAKRPIDDRAESAGKVSAFRALLASVRVGSPILTLSDWRTHHASCRTRPPYAWHPIGQAEAPGPGPEEPPAGPGARGAAAASPADPTAGVAVALSGLGISVSAPEPASDQQARPAEPGAQPGPSGDPAHCSEPALTALTEEVERQAEAEAPEPQPEPAAEVHPRRASAASPAEPKAVAQARPAKPGAQPEPSGDSAHCSEPPRTALREAAAQAGYPYAVPYQGKPPQGWHLIRGLLFPEDVDPVAEFESVLASYEVGATQRDAFEAHFLVSLAIVCLESRKEGSRGNVARVGSPIPTLSEWRTHNTKRRTPPPYARHPIGQAEAPEPQPEPAAALHPRRAAAASPAEPKAVAQARPAEPGEQPGPSGDPAYSSGPAPTALGEAAAQERYPYAVPYPCDPPRGWRVVQGLLFPEDFDPVAELESVLQSYEVDARGRVAFEAHFLVSLAIAWLERWKGRGLSLDVPPEALRP